MQPFLHFQDNEEELLKNMQDDVKWLKELVVPNFLIDLTDNQLDMLIKVCEVKGVGIQKLAGKTFEKNFFLL